MDFINQNPYNLKFTLEMNNKIICFLDLDVFIESRTIKTKTFFKQTDVNSYIGLNSHHYKPWAANIPKRQFKRIKRNCTDHSDFVVQSKLIKDQFLERNYNE